MASTIIWNDGAADGNFGTAGNWVGGVVPANGDSVVIDYGSRNITAGLDQTAKAFPVFILGPNYTGQCGNSATDPFKAAFTTLSIAGGASAQYFSAGAAAIADLRMDGCGLGGAGTMTAVGTVTKATIRKGTLRAYSGTWTAAHLVADPGSIAALNVYNADIATVYGFNGNGTIEDATTTPGRIRSLINSSANWTIYDNGQVDAITMAGGFVNFDTLVAVSGSVLVHGGTFNLTNVRAQTLALLEVFPGGRARVNNGAEIDVITSRINHGGAIDDGSFVA